MKKILKLTFSVCLALLCTNGLIHTQAVEYDAEIEVVDVQEDGDQVTVKVQVTNETFTSDQLDQMSVTAEAKGSLAFYYSETKTEIAEGTYEFTLVLPNDDNYLIATDGVSGANTSVSTMLKLVDDPVEPDPGPTDPEQPDNNSGTATGGNDTGDSTNVALWLCLLATGVAGSAVIIRKKKQI